MAAPGQLDRRFGDDGKLTTNLSNRGDGASGIAVQPDGRIVVVGGTEVRGRDGRFAVVRYKPGGRLDRTFSRDGVARVNFGAYWGDSASDVAVQSDGKIVVVGSTSDSETSFAIARFDPDGTLDTTFGDNGKVTTDFFPSGPYDTQAAYARSLAIQDDGKIVVAGSVEIEEECGTSDFALARYNPDGTLDSTFGDGGLVMTNVHSIEGGDDYAADVAIQSDGKIVAAGGSGPGCGGGLVVGVARYNPDGTLDTTFGGDGKLTTGFVNASPAAALAIQRDGKIVAAGKTGRRGDRFALIRYNSNGTLDTSFGGDGRAATNFTPERDRATDVVIQATGKILAVGIAGRRDSRFALARYNPNGSLDRTFGGDGRVRTNFSIGEDSAQAVAIQNAARIVAAGVADNRRDATFALARYRAG